MVPAACEGIRAQRENYEISPLGIHWPDIDEDLSVAGMLKGHRSRARSRPPTAAAISSKNGDG
jgi:hypothetical protein